MMNSNWIAAGCLDAQTQIKTSFVKLYQWPESDIEFLKRKNSKSCVCHESYVSRRQRHLRSYTFSKKETVAEKTKKWLTQNNLKGKMESKHKSGTASCSFLDCVFKLRFVFMCGRSRCS
ncbi:hypothetical protein RGQ29_022250 [Quercus rubra]|uniref:Uncharacterized protein n=1 Tax=Quercus rubra TaxID=3512 RepID=A0AAN7F2W0_QUERU|nr:hypothetical protein RGQ29_022250 [Quercus rubra]